MATLAQRIVDMVERQPGGVGKKFWLMGSDGLIRESDQPGKLGGYRRKKIYGRLDCPNALRHLAKGYYAKQRVFFADEATAISAGYRPCAKCLPAAYKEWKVDPEAWAAMRKSIAAPSESNKQQPAPEKRSSPYPPMSEDVFLSNYLDAVDRVIEKQKKAGPPSEAKRKG